MDRSWMNQSRVSRSYRDGVEEFLKFAFIKANDGKIICPCVKCGNGKWAGESEAREHLVCDGFIKGYTKWVAHGELARTAPEGSRYNADNDNDIFAQVLGKEKPGHVHMRGLGVCPTDLWGTMPSRATSYRMAMEFKTSLDNLNGKYDELITRYERMESSLINGGQHGGNNHSNPSSEPEGSSQLNRTTKADVSSQRDHSSSSIRHPTIQVGAIVSLKSISNRSHIVAKGIISSVDPKTQVGGVKLGRNWCEVSVQAVVDWDEGLVRPYGLLTTIGDAIGAPIAWPMSLVTPLDLDSS